MSYIIIFFFLFIGAQLAYFLLLARSLRAGERGREVHTIETPDGWTLNLHRFPPASGSGEPVFLCHGFSANHMSFCFPEGRSLAEHLSRRGYDCWLIDLRGTRTSEPPFGTSRYDATFDGYLLEDIPAALDFISKSTGFDKVHWVGHSLGGMLLYAYELTHGADRIASGVTIGSPPGFAGVNVREQEYVLSVISRVPSLCEFYLRCLTPLYPILRPSTRLVPINWKNMHPAVSAKAFYNMIELPSPLVAKTLAECAERQHWHVKGNTVDVLGGLQNLTVPLLVVHGKLDPLATPENVSDFFDKLPSPDKQRLELSHDEGCGADYNHVDSVFSFNGPAEVFEPITEWIAAHSIGGARIGKAAAKKAPKAKTKSTEPAVSISVTKEAPSKKGTLWGAALKDAAGVMSSFENSSASATEKEMGTTAPAKPRKKSKSTPAATKRTKKAAAKTASAKKTTPKKASKGKPAKKSVAKKTSKKSTAKKAAKKAVSSKKPAATKKSSAKKPPTKKKTTPKKSAVKKKATTKKSSVKKTVKKKPAAKPKSPKKATKKTSAKKKNSR